MPKAGKSRSGNTAKSKPYEKKHGTAGVDIPPYPPIKYHGDLEYLQALARTGSDDDNLQPIGDPADPEHLHGGEALLACPSDYAGQLAEQQRKRAQGAKGYKKPLNAWTIFMGLRNRHWVSMYPRMPNAQRVKWIRLEKKALREDELRRLKKIEEEYRVIWGRYKEERLRDMEEDERKDREDAKASEEDSDPSPQGSGISPEFSTGGNSTLTDAYGPDDRHNEIDNHYVNVNVQSNGGGRSQHLPFLPEEAATQVIGGPVGLGADLLFDSGQWDDFIPPTELFGYEAAQGVLESLAELASSSAETGEADFDFEEYLTFPQDHETAVG
ncbi:hypothetical protein I316_07682 [Kwoniella heveanensis BCC8398]|uniref:Uncharacterized protein n=1 Tax=Kwoniella heveanensis BCC8398 TaxID=1296120 RepID=A0A1B9GHT2_9TREE|nr:hypothetical protein I316_07682 [Kwoniella heveanensis BCC8398]